MGLKGRLKGAPQDEDAPSKVIPQPPINEENDDRDGSDIEIRKRRKEKTDDRDDSDIEIKKRRKEKKKDDRDDSVIEIRKRRKEKKKDDRDDSVIEIRKRRKKKKDDRDDSDIEIGKPKKSKKEKSKKSKKEKSKKEKKEKKKKGKKSKKRKGKKEKRKKSKRNEDESDADRAKLEKPKLDLADADVLGITSHPNINTKILNSPPIKTKNPEKVAKIIQEHLIQKQVIVTNNLMRSFKPVQVVMHHCGLFPVNIQKESNGTSTFSSNWKSIIVFKFFLTSAVIIYTLLSMLISYIFISQSIVLRDTPTEGDYQDFQEGNIRGKILIERNIVILGIIFLALLQSFVTVLVLLFRRRQLADHFTDWAEILVLIEMDVTSGAFLSSLMIVIVFCSILAILTVMCMFYATASTAGGPLGVGMLSLYYALPNEWFTNKGYKATVQLFGICITMLIFATSKAPLLYFMHECKLLKNAFSLWNGRLYNATLQTDEVNQSTDERTTYGILYEDYFNLIKLKEGMDKICAGIVETFIMTQSISVLLELYLLVRSLIHGGRSKQHEACEGSYFIRPLDWVPGLLLFIVSIIFLHNVFISAIELGEEIQSGLEIIRRSTMLGKKKEEELFFMASLFSNYTEYNYGTNFLQGVGLFFFDRGLHGGMMNITIALGIVVFQFSPKMDFRYFNSTITREDVGKFLKIIEYLPANHWLGTKSKCQ